MIRRSIVCWASPWGSGDNSTMRSPVWHRVEQARPDDEEPRRAIATLAVEKTIKFDEADPNKIPPGTRMRRRRPRREKN